MLHLKQAACAPNDALGRGGFDKLEAVAEGASLPDKGVDIDVAGRKGEFKANYFADWDFDSEDGREARLADIDRVTADDRRVSRIHAHVDF